MRAQESCLRSSSFLQSSPLQYRSTSARHRDPLSELSSLAPLHGPLRDARGRLQGVRKNDGAPADRLRGRFTGVHRCSMRLHPGEAGIHVVGHYGPRRRKSGSRESNGRGRGRACCSGHQRRTGSEGPVHVLRGMDPYFILDGRNGRTIGE
ncbi:MAG: hypothetical protein PWR17_612 [Candidatus Methanomethylophilaceae archaeon]|nr:hypothetical protein [Candidatus Methanomethylophilaceae archaeon]